MFAVIFEVNPKPGLRDEYLGYAKLLKPELEKIDGFIDNERFASKRRDGWLLSLSTWRDEKAVIRWRTFGAHHAIQEKGRAKVLRDYHLRVGEIVADTHLPSGEGLREQRFDETETGTAKLVTVTERMLEALPPEPDIGMLASRLGAPPQGAHPGLVGWDAFESIYRPGKFILLSSWRDAAAAKAWPAEGGGARRRSVRVIRDYGMFDRGEAPQYYPPVRDAPAA